jgi:hypothetical protein
MDGGAHFIGFGGKAYRNRDIETERLADCA